MRNFWDKWQRYGWFSPKEWTAFLIVVLGLGLVESWGLWGSKDFDVIAGLKNWIYWSILCTIVVFVHHAAQRFAALQMGFKLEHKLWWNGMIFSFIGAILSGGKFAFLAVTSTHEQLMMIHRLGAFRFGANLVTLAKIAMSGPIANMIFAGLVGALGGMGIIGTAFAANLFWLSAAFALWNMLPIPPLDGAKIFYWSRYLYFWVFFSLIIYGLVALVFGAFGFAYPIAVAFGLGATYVFVNTAAKGWN